MKKLSKLVLREHISPANLVGKKAQKFILGGSHSLCGELSCNGPKYICECNAGLGLFVTCNSSTAGNWCEGGSVSCREC